MNEQRSFRVGFWFGDASLEYGGIGPYALRILTALLTDNEPGWHFVLLCNAQPTEKLATLINEHASLIEVSLIPVAPPAIQREHYLHAWLAQLRLNLLHFPTQTILHPDMQTPYSLTMYGVHEPSEPGLSIPHIVTMHDVQELHFPENFTPAQRAVRAVHYWKAMEKAVEVIVSFNHVKADLLKFFRLPEEKIHVCPIPFGAINLAEPTPDAARAYAEKYASRTPFLLYPSHTWQHKNHAQLFRALRELKRMGFDNLNLICTGGTNHHYHAEVLKDVESLSLTDLILFAGIVPEGELRWLYDHTSLVTIPTRYEAGSFPLYEAMSLGAPVICSNVTSLPETIGDSRFIFDPHNVEALGALIKLMLTDEDFLKANRANSAQQSARFRRINAAAYFYETYRHALRLPSSPTPNIS